MKKSEKYKPLLGHHYGAPKVTAFHDYFSQAFQ